MNKKSIVATLVALALILTGTAYAYWTDALNVTTKATTGELDVTFVDLGLYAQYTNEEDPRDGGWSIIDGIGDPGFVESDAFMREATDYNIIASENSIDAYNDRIDGYSTVNFGAELKDAAPIKVATGPYNGGNANGSDTILIEVNDIYPGYAQAFRSDIVNVGTIAAKLGNIKVSVSGIDSFELTDATKNLLGVAFLVDREYFPGDDPQEGNLTFALANTAATYAGASTFKLGGVNFVRLSDLENLDISRYITESKVILNADSQDRMDMYLAIAMDPDADGNYTTGSTKVMSENENDDAASQLKGATISIDLLWDQFNATLPGESYASGTSNWLERQN